MNVIRQKKEEKKTHSEMTFSRSYSLEYNHDLFCCNRFMLHLRTVSNKLKWCLCSVSSHGKIVNSTEH